MEFEPTDHLNPAKPTHVDTSSPVPPEWQLAHTELQRLARTRAGLDWEEGQWLLRALRAGAHVRLAFGSFAEYAARLFGYSGRFTSEKLRVAEALTELGELSQALRDGVLNWSAVRELTRVATPSTEAEWLEVARGRSAREIESLVSGRRHGDKPDTTPDPKLVRHVLRFDVSGEALALIREALAKVRRDSGQSLDDDSALLLLARIVLGGQKDEGRSSYQIALDVCESCRRGRQRGDGEAVDVSATVVEMASCDAQHIGPVRLETHMGADCPPEPATQSVPPATRRRILRRDGKRCVVPGCRHSTWVDVHHIQPREEGGRHTDHGLACFCTVHHRAIHDGRLSVQGHAPNGLTFRHADGTVYGGEASPRRAEAGTVVFQMLRHLGFRETESKRALEKVLQGPTHEGCGDTIEGLLRAALLILTPG